MVVLYTMNNMATQQTTIELPITGMDCAECALHVQHALQAVPGVHQADVLLAAEKAIVRLDRAGSNAPLCAAQSKARVMAWPTRMRALRFPRWRLRRARSFWYLV